MTSAGMLSTSYPPLFRMVAAHAVCGMSGRFLSSLVACYMTQTGLGEPNENCAAC
jgi:hypothetical protein